MVSIAVLQRWIGVAVLAAPIFLGASTPVRAAEQIDDYQVTAEIHRDGSATITENIRVTAENRQIKHGIYRDFPTTYQDRFGNLFRVPFSILDVQRDRVKETYRVESKSNGVRIYIGDSDRYVPFGGHIYSITYEVGRVVGHFPTGDEFYWNVTGNGWVFPIRKASIRVKFPEGSKVIQSTAYTGVQGATGRDYIERIYGAVYEASTTRPLQPYEGLTIVAAVPAGTIATETFFQTIHYFLKDNSMWLVWWAFAISILIYLTVCWHRYGRDEKFVVIPRFDAPADVSPDMMRYLRNRSYDDKVFSSMIVNGISAGVLTLEEDGDEDVIKRNNAGGREFKVPYLEFLTPVFNKEIEIRLPRKGLIFTREVQRSLALALQNSKVKHSSQLQNDSDLYLKRNTGYLVKGFILGLLGVALSYYQAENQDQMYFMIVASVIFYGLMQWLFVRIMPQYTPQGREVMEHAEGLKMYMETAERERMNVLYPKEVTPEKFEKLLPYALALGVDQAWCDFFASQVASQSMSQDHYSSRYYGRYSNLGNRLSSLSSDISSASTPPGSSSGFGGGGSSGGGGGGGGGGGW